MLSPSQVKKVRKLLADGWSLRKIARKMRLARNTVDAIAHGRRHVPLPSPDEDGSQCLGLPVRCTTCGGMMFPPCRLCRVRAIKARKAFVEKMRRAGGYRVAG
jgi:transcriptional regulator with XRE-family HTH domain